MPTGMDNNRLLTHGLAAAQSGHSGPVRGLAFTPDNTLLVTASGKHFLLRRDLDTGRAR